MEKEIDLLELFKVLLSKWWILVICLAVGGLLGFSASKIVMDPMYEAYTTMYVKSSIASAPEQEGNIEQSELTTSRSLVGTYVAVLESNTVMSKVGEGLMEECKKEDLEKVFSLNDGIITPKAIRSHFTMSSVDDTEVMKISATTEDPNVSAAMCNILAEVAPESLERVVGAGSVEVIDTAAPNPNPVSPNIPRNTLLGALIGFILAAGVIILLSFLDDTVQKSEEIREQFDKPILGEVQRMFPQKEQKKKKKKQDFNVEARKLLTDERIPFNVKESYKSIRTNVMFALGTSGKKSIAVSSINPGEGKSTTAANIAIAFSQTGSKVLLIDADMRKPVQQNTFKVKNSEGLSTLIIGESTLDESIRKEVAAHLDLLPSGPIPPNPSELLASEQFAALMEGFEKEYDYVVLDTPPIHVVTDAMAMKDVISGILLVLRHGVTRNQEVFECMRRIDFADASLLGFVLNDIPQKTGFNYYRRKHGGYGYGGYYGGYEDYYGYGEKNAD